MHISDLHRDSESRITTTALLSSLSRDLERYSTSEGLPRPDLAVVSGDIVYGVGDSEPNALQRLSEQYDEAFNTLVGLADRFFDGDRERIILVPGNHDISMPHVKQAMSTVDIPSDPQKKRLIAKQLSEPGTFYRFNLGEFTLLKIDNIEIYNKRLEPYAEFYRKFYNGKRTFPLEPEKQYSIHDFPSLGVCIVGLSSCHENDLYNRTGQINVDALTRAMDEVKPQVSRGQLLISAWHHSTQGGPKDNDYIDQEFIRHLLNSNCTLGLHGHQHHPQLLEHRSSADNERKISIISAGTLCGGPRSLPPGRMRGYNLVVLDQKSCNGTVHIRGMSNGDFTLPIWEKGYLAEFGGSSMTFEFTKNKMKQVSPFELAEKADGLIRSGKYKEAYDIVSQELADPWLRKIALDALIGLKDWNQIISLISLPTSDEDFIILCEAYIETKNWESLKALIVLDKYRDNGNLAIRQMVDMCNAKLKGK